MPVQDFNIYTAKGYEGELVDSGPRTVSSGVLTGVAQIGFGKAVERDAATVERGIKPGSTEVSTSSTTNVYALTQREYNHEASVRPSQGNDTFYNPTESVSIMREGFLYLVARDHAVVGGDQLVVEEASGIFVGSDSTAGTVAGESVCLNIVAEESAQVGEVFKARIDIISQKNG